MKRHTHQELDTEVFSIAGHYKIIEEGKMTFDNREFFYVMGGAKVSPRPDLNIIRYLRKALISDHHSGVYILHSDEQGGLRKDI